MIFRKWVGEVKGRLELFQKIICFGGATSPKHENMFLSYQNQQQAANPHDLKLQSRFHWNFIFLPKSTEQMTVDLEISIVA